ncbi:MAG: hypothetical protein AAFU41_19900, partial [Pseudomonadota bacterium]
SEFWGCRMFARFRQALYVTRGEKYLIAAYAAVIAMTTGLAVLVLTRADQGVVFADGSMFGYWVLIAGALSGAVALYTARGWMGQSGALGVARALVGIVAIALLGSLIAGTLIQPLYGTFYAPVLLVDAFVDMPLLAGVCFAVLMGAHYCIGQYIQEKELGMGRAPRRASEELSRISQTNLYRHHYRG